MPFFSAFLFAPKVPLALSRLFFSSPLFLVTSLYLLHWPFLYLRPPASPEGARMSLPAPPCRFFRLFLVTLIPGTVYDLLCVPGHFNPTVGLNGMMPSLPFYVVSSFRFHRILCPIGPPLFLFPIVICPHSFFLANGIMLSFAFRFRTFASYELVAHDPVLVFWFPLLPDLTSSFQAT